ncbi:MAG TPA: ribosome maturation factor RimM [Alphaproteobacteria bacterium]|nr:ribosome maturation factor RimM [Alphaproteobacteria bacterium]
MEVGNTETRVCVAAVAAAHGVRGLLRLKPFTEKPEDCVAYGPFTTVGSNRAFRFVFLGLHKNQVLVRFEGVGDRTTAEALRGTRLYVPRTALPEPEDEEEFYHADLIGLAAELPDGMTIGRVRAIYDFGAGDSLELTDTATEKPILIPFTREAVPEIDLANKRIVVDPPAGLMVASEEIEETAES